MRRKVEGNDDIIRKLLLRRPTIVQHVSFARSIVELCVHRMPKGSCPTIEIAVQWHHTARADTSQRYPKKILEMCI
jgi:hypothetical protein